MEKKTNTRRLRLILGDQLNHQHPWFDEIRSDTTYLLAEVFEEATYVRHHVQKVCGIFAAMATFATQLRASGHEVLHLTLDDTAAFNEFPTLIHHLVRSNGYDILEYQRPDEHRLLAKLRMIRHHHLQVVEHDTAHFLVPFARLSRHFKAGRPQRMEAFYRRMRRSHNLLMNSDEPAGGRWNYDADNRKRLKAEDLERVPPPLTFENPVTDILERIDRHQIETIGRPADPLPWPIDREQALALLAYFCEHCLPAFGTFQDAMVADHPYRASLFHSRLSFAINIKLLSPLEVINAAVVAYEASNMIPLPQVEGFVRQILGWREFVRGIYWMNAPGYGELNELDATRRLPAFFWTGDTDMRCLASAIDDSLSYGYAHHIQRLMVTGNFCLLAGIAPDEVDAWYLGIYVDAFEWVEMPNTRGMSQFADGGLVGSKPYAASGQYINRMSDYCSHCRYRVREKTGDSACPLNSLYWHFMHRHREKFERNPRTAMVFRNWDRQSVESQRLILAQADKFLDALDQSG